jgi:hypothetical protein
MDQMQNFNNNNNTPARPPPPQMRPGSSGNHNLGYAPSPVAYPPGSLPYGAMPTPGGGQKRKLEGDISTNPHIPAGPGPGAGLAPGGGPMMAGTSATTPSGQGQAQPGPATAAATTTGAPASTSQPERKFRPPMPPPHLLASLVPESKMFKDLIEMEQRLDWTMLRKRAEVNDALGRVVKVSQQQRRIRTWLDQDELICILSFGSQIKRTLRVYLSNTARNQEWQRGELRVPRACP